MQLQEQGKETYRVLVGKPERKKETTWKTSTYMGEFIGTDLRNQDGRQWTGLIWLLIGRRAGCCKNSHESLVFLKWEKKLRLAKNLLCYREGTFPRRFNNIFCSEDSTVHTRYKFPDLILVIRNSLKRQFCISLLSDLNRYCPRK